MVKLNTNNIECQAERTDEKSTDSTSSTESDHPISRLRRLLGDNAVFVPCPRGQKGPRFTGWQGWTASDTDFTLASGGFDGRNIAVLLGERTAFYCLDFDDEENRQTFTAANPSIADTFQVTGRRGAKYIISADTPPPFSGKDVTFDGSTVCEILQGNATIAGTHPEGIEYQDNGKPVQSVSWESIRWPVGWELPGQEKCEPNIHRPDPIILPSAEEPAIQPVAEEIFRRIAGTRAIFTRGGRAVELEAGDDGGGVLRMITPAGFCSRLENFGRPMKWVSGGRDAEPLLKNCSCSKELAEKLLAAQQINLLPRITSIVTGPVAIERNGKLEILGDGFHEKGSGGILVRGTVEPDRMTLTDAVRIIEQVLQDFRFATEGDRARAVAFLLSPALKGILDKAFPIFIVEAVDSQTGKGYLVITIGAVYGERPALVGQRNGGVGGFDESLGARLIEGRPFVLFDNLKGKIDSAYLEMILTAPSVVPCRIPHRGEISVDVSGFTFALTSNGVETTRDLANRANVIRLRRKEDGRFTEFAEGDLLEHVQANRGRFIGAVFTVLAEWVSRGKPLSDDYRGPGAFRTWWRAVDYIGREIIGTTSPLEGLHEAAERTANPALQWLRNVCLAVEAEERLGEGFTASGLVELSQEHGLTVPGMRPEGAGAQKVIGGIMKRIFKDEDHLQLDDWTIHREQKETRREDGKGYWNLNFYVVQKQ